MLVRILFNFFSARVRTFSSVTFLTLVQILVEFRKYICDSLSRFDGFAFFVFDFGDEDSLLEMFLVPLSSYRIFWIFSSLVLLLLFLIQFLIFLLISRIRFFHASQSTSFLVRVPEIFIFSFCFLLRLLLLLPRYSSWWVLHLPRPSMLLLLPSLQLLPLLPSVPGLLLPFLLLFCRNNIFGLIRFRFFDFLLEVSVHQLMFIFECDSITISRRRLVATRFPSCLWNFEPCHNTSVVASHVNCVVCLRVFAPAVMFSVSQDVIQQFLCTFLSMVSQLFLR